MGHLVFGGNDVVEINDVDPSVRAIVKTTDNLLAQKRPAVGEIIVTLFEACNLTCKFCNQDHNSEFGFDTVASKFDDIVKAIEMLKKMRKTSFNVNLMGGEIFMDSIPDQMLQDYADLIIRVRDWAAPVEINFTFISNLVHYNTRRVKDLIDSLRVRGITISLGTSYDPSMRFNAANLLIFRKNVEIYREYLSVVNVILTAPNIQKFLKDQTPHFDFLYENFEIFFDYYTPETHADIMSPKDHEIRDFYIFLLEKYPETYPIKDFRENQHNPMTCQSTYTIMPDGRAGRCTILLNNWQAEIAPKTAGEMEHEFISRMDCLSCEYFARCGLGCFLQQHFNGANRTLNHCWMKDVHNRIDEFQNV